MRKCFLSFALLLCFIVYSQQRNWVININRVEPFPVTAILTNDTVRWVNNDDTLHTVNGTSFHSGVLAQGDDYLFTFNSEESQSFSYHCDFHPDVMKGAINVLPVIDYFPNVQFSSRSEVSPLPGFSVSVIEGVSTIFSSTPGIFNFEDGYTPNIRALSTNYFLSPDELPDSASTLSTITGLLIVLCYVTFNYL